jgi:hypothetical protein
MLRICNIVAGCCVSENRRYSIAFATHTAHSIQRIQRIQRTTSMHDRGGLLHTLLRVCAVQMPAAVREMEQTGRVLHCTRAVSRIKNVRCLCEAVIDSS